MEPVKFEKLSDVAAELRRIAGELFPQTESLLWAEAVDALEHCAQRIDDLAGRE